MTSTTLAMPAPRRAPRAQPEHRAAGPFAVPDQPTTTCGGRYCARCKPLAGILTTPAENLDEQLLRLAHQARQADTMGDDQ